METQENIMHPELNNSNAETAQGIPELLKQVNEDNHEHPVVLPNEGFVSPEAIRELTNRINTMGLASQEDMVKASNGASELGPVSMDKINEVTNVALEQAADSIEARGKLEAILAMANAVEGKYKNLDEVTVEVTNVYNSVIGQANRAIIAYTNRSANRDRFINKLS